MYYELGTMVSVRKDASPFAKHEKGISIPSNDVVGEIVTIHPTILAYTVRLSKKYVLTFDEDDIYGLPGWMSDKRYMFHKMLGSIAADVHQFYYFEEFEDFVIRAEEKQKQSSYYQNHRWDPKFMENMYPVKSSLKALDELNRREFERIAAEPIRFNIDEFKLPTKEEINAMFGVPKFEYKKIIFSGPCTIILWMDGTKTMARTNKEETFDPEKGVAICFMKKILGHTETNKILRKASKQYEDYIVENGIHVTLFDDLAAYLKNPFNHIDQSTIDEVKKVEEDQDE